MLKQQDVQEMGLSCAILAKLYKAIQRKRRILLSDRVNVLHDIISPILLTNSTIATKVQKWKIWSHAPPFYRKNNREALESKRLFNVSKVELNAYLKHDLDGTPSTFRLFRREWKNSCREMAQCTRMIFLPKRVKRVVSAFK